MICCCDIVVAVCFNALDRVIWIEAKLIKHFFINSVIDGHNLLARK